MSHQYFILLFNMSFYILLWKSDEVIHRTQIGAVHDFFVNYSASDYLLKMCSGSVEIDTVWLRLKNGMFFSSIKFFVISQPLFWKVFHRRRSWKDFPPSQKQPENW